MMKDSLVAGAWIMKKDHMNGHPADRRGRLYLCDCMKAFRLGVKVKYPLMRAGRQRAGRTI